MPIMRAYEVRINMSEIIKLTPEEALKRTKERWVLRLVKKVERPSKEPREYEVIGRWEKSDKK